MISTLVKKIGMICLVDLMISTKCFVFGFRAKLQTLEPKAGMRQFPLEINKHSCNVLIDQVFLFVKASLIACFQYVLQSAFSFQ